MITAGQIYQSNTHPTRTIRITRYYPGHDRAQVEDAASGKRFRHIRVTELHDTPTTTAGTHRRTGYTLTS